ncbi:MAG: HNH endonuclease [Chitinophagaceae bacterium]|nr:HNH endonuclease [Chitinophagaceae bacterium]
MEIASVQVHRIVATAFHGEAPTSQHVVDHKDTNKCNNRPENLRWVTKFENIMLNPITVKRIEWVIGDKIEKFLEDPAKYKDKFQDQNFAWMRTVTVEEGQSTLERLRDWAKSDKQPAGGSLGEWIYSRGNLYEQQVEDLSAIIPSETPNAAQRNYKMLCNFPFCPPSVDADPIAAYKRRLGPGNVFVACEYFISACYSRTVSEDGSSLYVISESQGRIKYWGLAKITYENGQFVHESLGVFLEMQGAEHRLSEVQGFEWTGGSQEDEIPEMAEVPDLIPSKTPGAVQRNWKTLSEFPACPQDYTGMPLEAYAGRLAVGSAFCRNEQYSATVFKAGISLDRKSLCVITEPETAGGGSIKPFALTAITYENGIFVHESKGTFFEQNSAEKHFTLALGQEWTGGEGIDDYC